jgi:CheY-like chemotaxis protein/HPt (histidine-containing phosphotransfer) domain-containing protein
MLEDLGCEADAASDGAEAVECAKARSYDLILMDMRMPKMNGVLATRAIRALPGYRDTPILSMTASALTEDRQRCREAGMNAHLGKPVTPATLAAALGQWLPNIAVPGNGKPACDSEVSRALAEIPGLDVQKVLQRSPEQLANYYALLNRFVTLHGQDMVRLREHLVACEYDAAHDVVHKLQGISGLIGVPSIESVASEIAQGLRSGVDQAGIASLASTCEAELARLREAVRRLQVLPRKTSCSMN